MIQSRRLGIAAMASLSVPILTLFNLLRDPENLLDLYMAVKNHGDPNHVVPKLAGAVFAIIGAAAVAWLSPSPQTPVPSAEPKSAPPAEKETL